jgi:hypothetical protein
MSAYHPDGPHALARPALTAEDLDLYAAKFFPHLLPAHRLALIRELLGAPASRRLPEPTDH